MTSLGSPGTWGGVHSVIPKCATRRSGSNGSCAVSPSARRKASAVRSAHALNPRSNVTIFRKLLRRVLAPSSIQNHLGECVDGGGFRRPIRFEVCGNKQGLTSSSRVAFLLRLKPEKAARIDFQ